MRVYGTPTTARAVAHIIKYFGLISAYLMLNKLHQFFHINECISIARIQKVDLKLSFRHGVLNMQWAAAGDVLIDRQYHIRQRA